VKGEGEIPITTTKQNRKQTSDAKTITHNQQADAQSVPEEQLTCIPPPPSTRVTAEHSIIWYGVSLQLIRVSCLTVSHLSLLPAPSLLAVRGTARNREGFDTVQALFSNSKNVVMLATLF